MMTRVEELEFDLREEQNKFLRAKASLKRDMDFLCDDFAEYVGTEASPENYESLKAIFKKTLRALKRAGMYDPEEN